MTGPVIAVVPALDEEAALPEVVRGLVRHAEIVVVVDNGSRDRTAEVARAAGARVVLEPERGYGAACLAGAALARELGAGVLLFADADGSDDPDDAPSLLAPILEGRAQLVLGVRRAEPGAMTGAQRVGNWLAPRAMRWLAGARYADMPPFKAIARPSFDALDVRDRTYGFTVELMLRAHARRLRVVEVPVRCRVRRGGSSKVSGTLAGSARAAGRILWTIGRHAAVLRAEEAP